MRNFLKGRKLWLYVTNELKKPVKGAFECDDLFPIRLIGMPIIIRFLLGYVIRLPPQSLIGLVTLMIPSLHGICKANAILHLIVLGNISSWLKNISLSNNPASQSTTSLLVSNLFRAKLLPLMKLRMLPVEINFISTKS
jgi:hypothetical protein